MQPRGNDARLISLPDGIQVMRNGHIRYYWYNKISRDSRLRLWGLTDKCLQLASNTSVYIWKTQRG